MITPIQPSGAQPVKPMLPVRRQVVQQRPLQPLPEDTVTLRFQGNADNKKPKRSTKLLLASLLGGAALLGGHFANNAITKAPLAPMEQTQSVRANQTPAEAKKAFDDLVERYSNDSPSNVEAYQKYLNELGKVDQTKLTKEYKGLHLLFDHHLRLEIFKEQNGANLARLGVDIGSPRNEAERFADRTKVYGRPKAELMESGIGKERYDALIRYKHYVNLNSEELIAYSGETYRQIEAEMNKLAKEISPGKTWQQVYEELRKDHPKKDELLPTYKDEVARVRQFIRDKGLATIPRESIRVIETPDNYRDSIPFAAYMYNGGGRGTFFVTTVMDTDPAKEEDQLRAHSYYFIPPVVVHEAMPGHHLQAVVSDNFHIDPSNPDNKTLLRVLEMTPDTPYYTEGWGVYSEELMKEQGYYGNDAKSKKTELFAMRNLLWRAARAYIDPQIHTGKMNYDQAVDFLVKNVLMERDRAEVEVNRYYQRPTEVPSYMIGDRQIMQLRKQLQEKGNFDLKRFNDEMMKMGGVPVPALARILFDQPLDLPAPHADAPKTNSGQRQP